MLKTACGSPCYAAPEMIASKKYHGLEVDIWSCGVILFTMVCGTLPFEDSNTSELYKKILSGEYVLPKFISPEFKDLLEKILNVDPSKRYSLEEIYAHPWCKQVDNIPLNSGIIVGYHRMPIDHTILAKLA
jgi:5'-AMP-activated protein kinase catalytic alpha subunit